MIAFAKTDWPIKNLNAAMMLVAFALILLIGIPPLSSLAKDTTAKQISAVENGIIKDMR